MADRQGLGGLAFAGAARCYWFGVFPAARRELGEWRRRAESIPDRALREDALFTHRTKGRHSEGLAAYAVLAPRSRRGDVVRGLVAFELTLDYLDTLSELPSGDPWANSLQLHLAFSAAVDISAPAADYYALHPHRDDAGYLEAQVTACRDVLGPLPSYRAVAAPLARCARFSARAQSVNNTIPIGLGEEALATWKQADAGPAIRASGCEWWEIVAAGASSLPIGVLMALAASPSITAEEAALVEDAYFPWVAALSTLLDCLVDLDGEGFEANLLNRYPSLDVAGERLAWIASESLRRVSLLPRGEWHAAILAGMAGYYLSFAEAWSHADGQVAQRVLDALGGRVRLAMSIHRGRRLLSQ